MHKTAVPNTKENASGQKKTLCCLGSFQDHMQTDTPEWRMQEVLLSRHKFPQEEAIPFQKMINGSVD